jgi:mannose-6-phosphate isomerase-like protein (cupin superfamily)
MNSEQVAVILKSFDAPDEVRVMEKGKFELVHPGGITIGRATYERRWKWSEHVSPSVGATRCPVEHVGLVLSGTATVAFDDGRVIELHAGDLFYVPPVPHDSWVIGDADLASITELKPWCVASSRARRNDRFVLKASHEQVGPNTFTRNGSAIFRTSTATRRHAHRRACQPRTCRREAGATIRQSSVGSGFHK